MKQFFKIVFGTVIGIFLFLIICFGLILLASGKKEELKENTVLKLELNKRIVERETDNFLSQLNLPFGDTEGSIGLLELKKAIKNAKADSRIKGIVLKTSSVEAGYASLEEIRRALLDFKSTGKFLIAYGDSYSEGAYFLASVADKIYLPEEGGLELNGLEVEILFFKKLLDKLEIKPELFKVGEYKSASEPFIRENMSDENRKQLTELLDSFYKVYISDVAKSRKIEDAKLKEISDSMKVRKAQDALQYNLITDVGYFSEAEDFIRKKLLIQSKEKINYIGYNHYLYDIREDEEEKTSSNKIAVIYANGSIEDGQGTNNTIGGESLAREIRKAREDDKIKAIVLRVNSPGGSALASDIIWNEVQLCKKPIIASMGDMAASGGYYISMACDTILAEPSTITGSIGVFGLFFQGEKFLNEKIGITTDRVKTGQYSDIGSFTRPVSSSERQIIQSEVDRIYDSFTQKAAKGRKISVDKLREVAKGRVWSGTQAKELKLVDMFGGLDDAVDIAAEKAKLGKDYKIVYLPEIKTTLLKELLLQMGDEDEAALLKSEFGSLYPYLKKLKEVKSYEGIQARLPYEIQIK
ncbi:protease IV [Sporocytophaga myxococcoides]|uniref:Protease IV n=1 Tax=Sporocytophaga myxococcoides TaxID=153721 RepID=A0A098LBG2_9BACT|nr:signal peptide peptidase SppA [Sporocytophaga myxococcoides]GAL84225.1 protease IV [Sporocytophaga myxococcoides]